MRRPLLLLAGLLAALSLAAGVVAVTWLLDDGAIEQRGSVTEGVVTEVRGGLGRDVVVVRLDLLDGRELAVTADGPTAVGQRLQVEYDPDGGPQDARVAGSERDLRDARTLLAAAGAGLVLAAVLAPVVVSRRRPRPGRSAGRA